jgi:hypothetical protein
VEYVALAEQTPDQGASWARERLGTDLRYVTRHFDWTPPPAIIAAIVDWHIKGIAAARRSDVWVPGMAGSRGPVVQEVLHRYYAHQIGTAVAQLLGPEPTNDAVPMNTSSVPEVLAATARDCTNVAKGHTR